MGVRDPGTRSVGNPWLAEIPDVPLKAAMEQLHELQESAADGERLLVTPANLVIEWAKRDPQAALDWVMSEMVKADPKGALDYIQNITDEDFQTHAFNGAVRQIGFEDIQLAAGFIDANPDFVTDEVRSIFIWQAIHRDAALGASAIANIHDESRRHLTYLEYFRRWLERDPAAVTQWRAANDLPESIRPSVDGLIETMGKGPQ